MSTKTALVTGAGNEQGIGFATAKQLIKQNYEVFVLGRNPDQIPVIADRLGAHAIVADISNLNHTLVNDIAQLFPDGLDALVNNAAIGEASSLTDPSGSQLSQAHFQNTYDQFEREYKTNLLGPLQLIQSLAPALSKKQGSITNISSIAVNKAVPGLLMYSGSKGALEASTRCLAVELAPQNIRVNCVSLGAITTTLIYNLNLPEEALDNVQKMRRDACPMKREGSTQEVAEVIVAQLESNFVTGATWCVDGGTGIM